MKVTWTPKAAKSAKVHHYSRGMLKLHFHLAAMSSLQRPNNQQFKHNNLTCQNSKDSSAEQLPDYKPALVLPFLSFFFFELLSFYFFDIFFFYNFFLVVFSQTVTTQTKVPLSRLLWQARVQPGVFSFSRLPKRVMTKSILQELTIRHK